MIVNPWGVVIAVALFEDAVGPLLVSSLLSGPRFLPSAALILESSVVGAETQMQWGVCETGRETVKNWLMPVEATTSWGCEVSWRPENRKSHVSESEGRTDFLTQWDGRLFVLLRPSSGGWGPLCLYSAVCLIKYINLLISSKTPSQKCLIILNLGVLWFPLQNETWNWFVPQILTRKEK